MKQNSYFQRTLSALLLLMASSLSWASDFKAENADGVTIYYNLTNNGTEAEVTFGEWKGFYDEVINIPSTVAYNDKTLSVTSIGDSAFYDCTFLTSVTIPNSVTSIGNSAFEYCSRLTSVNIPDGVTSIGEMAFCNCSRLTSIDIPNSVTSIGMRAFTYCSGLTSVTIPNSVTSIGDWAFHFCSSLTSIDIPNSVTSIGKMAFTYCSGLTSIVVADNNPVYDSRNNCNAIIETESNTLIQGCNNTVIPESVTSIGDYAFSYCSSLTSITIPEGVISIGDYAFVGCSGLTSIVIDGNNSVYNSRNNCNAIIETKSNTLIQGCNNTVIPEGVTSIGDYAFQNCSGLTSMTIPEGVTSIGDVAFYNCSSLTSVNIPEGVISIGESAFDHCSSLTSATIPESVTNIGKSAFEHCSSLTSINIPKGVTSIDGRAFYACSSLTSVYSSIENPFSITTSYVFYRIADDATLYVPQGTKNRYEAAGWTDYFSNIVEFDVTGISEVNPGQSAESYAVYDLNGAKVSVKGGDLKSLPRGIYVVNGKKTIVK